MNFVHLLSRYYTASSVAVTTATIVSAAGRSLLPVIAPAARELLMTALTLFSGAGAFMANLSAGIAGTEEVSVSYIPVVILVGILVGLNGTAVYLMHRFSEPSRLIGALAGKATSERLSAEKTLGPQREAATVADPDKIPEEG